MKRVFAILMVVLLLALPTACGESPDDIITIEADVSYFNDGIKMLFPTQLTDAFKKDGFISVEKKNNEIIEYKIKRSDYYAYRARGGS